MKTTQAWGWLTAGVLALGLNGIYQDGGAAWAHRIVDRAVYSSTAVLALASGRADQFLTQARMMAGRDEGRPCRIAAAVARVQMVRRDAGFARFDVMSAREEAQLAKIEAERARIEAQAARIQFATVALKPIIFKQGDLPVVCPRVRVTIPRAPMMPRIKLPVSIGHGGTEPV